MHEHHELSSEIEAALEQHLRELEAGERPDLATACEALAPAQRRLFRIEALIAEVLWHEAEGGVGGEARRREALERCADDEEREEVRRALEDVSRAERSLPASVGVGDVIAGRYELREEIGRGGIGIVFRAHDRELGEVAVKAVRVDPGRDVAALRDNLLAESRTLAALRELGGIVTVYDVRREGNQVFVVLELVEGESLEDVIAKGADLRRARPALRLEALRGFVGAAPDPDEGGPLAERTWYRAVASVGARMARTLHRAHELDVIHRDIKPQNVMLRPGGEPVLLDLGLGGRLKGQEERRFRGTPEYLAPEQIEGYSIGQDRRTDVYALGLVLHELLTSQRTFPRKEGEPLEALLARVSHRRFEALRDVDPRVPSVLASIVETAIAKDADARYSSAGKLAEDLELWLAGRPPRHAPISAGARLGTWARRPAVWSVLGVLLVALVLWGAWPPGRLDLEYFHRDAEEASPSWLAPGQRIRPGSILGAEVSHADMHAFGASYWENGGELYMRPVKLKIDGRLKPACSGAPLGDGTHRIDVAKAEDNEREGILLLLCRSESQAEVVRAWIQSWERVPSEELDGGLILADLLKDDALEGFRAFYEEFQATRGGDLEGDVTLPGEDVLHRGYTLVDGITLFSALYPVEEP